MTTQPCDMETDAAHLGTVEDAVDAALLLLTRAAGLEAAGDDRGDVLEGMYTAAKWLSSLRHQGVDIGPGYLAGFRDAIRWAHSGPTKGEMRE